MRIARLVTGMIVALACVSLHTQAPKEEITVTGKLVRAMAIGGESTGWVIELDPAVTIGGKELHSIQVSYGETARLEEEANKRVRATGKLGQRSGVETGETACSHRFLNRGGAGLRDEEGHHRPVGH